MTNSNKKDGESPQPTSRTGKPKSPTPSGPFNRPLIRHRRMRAQKQARDRFLYGRIIDDVVARLEAVNRTFGAVLLLGDVRLTSLLAEQLQHKFKFVIFADHTGFHNKLDVVCSEEALPFRAGSFDLVINLLSLHGVNKVPQALQVMKKSLKPDGLFITAFFGGDTLGDLRRTIYAAEDKLYNFVSPRIASMIRLEQASALLSASGFTLPVADRDIIRVSYKNLPRLYEDLRLMGETNSLADRSPAPVSRRFLAEIEAAYPATQNTRNGKTYTTYNVVFEILWLTGWSPHPDQPKPLKPGSAKTRLADALGVPEGKI